MKPMPPRLAADASGEIPALIEALHGNAQRLEELTAGEVDTVADSAGRTFLLRPAQDHLRHNEAAKQAAIVNALPAHIALLDAGGIIILVNAAWRAFARANALPGQEYGVGVNYLELCDAAQGSEAAEARQVAAGIRAVLAGEQSSFSIEYPCHSPDEQRWFLMAVTPLADARSHGVVVMHLDITQRKRSENELLRFVAAMDAIADGIFLTDRSTMSYIHVNDAACRQQNLTREQLLALGPMKLLAKSRAEVERDYDAVIASGMAAEPFELLWRCADGSPLWVELRRHAQWSGDRWTMVTLVRDITESKRHDQEILATKNQLQGMLDALPDLLFELGLDGRYYAYHSPRKELLAAPVEGLLGRTVGEILPADAADSVLSALREANTTGHSAGKQFKLALSQGIRWFELSVARMAMVEGQEPRFTCLSRDITDRKQAEDNLAANEALLKQFIRHTPAAIAMLDNQMRYIQTSERWMQDYNIVGQDIVGKSHYTIFPEISQRWKDIHQRVLAGAIEHCDEDPFPRADGSIDWLQWEARPWYQSKDKVGGIIFFTQVINERKAAEARIKYLNRLYAMQSGINALIVRVRDRDELFREACRVAVDIGGFRMAMIGMVNRDEMKIFPAASMGKDEALLDAIKNILLSVDLASNTMVARAIRENLIIISNDSQRDPQVVFGKQYAEAGVNSIIILPLILADEVFGALAIYAIESNFFHDEELKLLSALAGDISFAMEYLAAQEALRRLNDELESKVAVRTADLEQARIEAERANAAKNTFLATMSHEIRTPMNGVIGMIDVLQQSSLSGPQIEMSNIIRDSAYALLAVINDILDFSKIEAGKLEIDSVPMCVAEVVEKTCEIMDRMAQKNEVELSLFTDPAIPVEVLGDPGRLRQILINLVNNGIKFSSGKERSGRVSLRALLAETTPAHVILDFEVADNGIGIDAATRARLFSSFIQADASTTRNYGGTGLGLAISRQLANMMHGEIAVQSELGKGALFRVRIPFALLTEQLMPGNNSSGKGKSDRNPNLVAGLSCLVVGGPDGLAGDLATYLEYAKAVVERAADVASAQEWIANHRSGRAIVVVDTRVAKSPLDQLITTARALPNGDIHFVLIGAGPRREPRVEDQRSVSVTGIGLTRRALLNAVALAGGRVQAHDAEGLADDSTAPALRVSSETLRRRGSRILVAEDNAINQNVIVHQLGLLGYVADLADDGREALARWHMGNHALLLTDLHMPKMDGYELTAAIRGAEGKGERLPIIALTANALKSEEMRCKAAGMDAYLSKPVLLDQLQAMLETWLPIPGLNETPGDAPAPTASPRLAVLDRAVLPKQIGNDPALVAQFFQDYRRSAQDAAVEIRTALVAGNCKATSDGAHKLKSSSRAVGALALGDICARLEQAGKDADAGAALALGPEFEKTLAAVVAAIDHEEN